MTSTVGEPHYFSGELDAEIANKIQPGELEIFLAEGVQHLPPPAEIQMPQMNGVTDKKFACGCSTPEA